MEVDDDESSAAIAAEELGLNFEDAGAADQIMSDERPAFPALSAQELAGAPEQRRVPCPPHRLTPLKENWLKIFTPIVEHMNLQIRQGTSPWPPLDGALEMHLVALSCLLIGAR